LVFLTVAQTTGKVRPRQRCPSRIVPLQGRPRTPRRLSDLILQRVPLATTAGPIIRDAGATH
jgi:hypothetical protein